MGEPQVSVVIPAFNAEETIDDAIASALGQRVDDIEVIVVDDGSTDLTVDAARARGDARLRVIRHDGNLGAAAARNSGVAAARGKLIAFLDTDDRWFVDKLGTQVELLARRTEPDVTGSVHSVMLEHRDGHVSAHLLPAELDLRGDLMWGCRLCPGSSLLVTRDCLDQVGPFDARLRRLEDWDWLLRFSARYRLAIATAPLAWIRHSASASREEVTFALEYLREKHTEMIAGLDRIERRKLESTFLVERAGAEYRDGDQAQAILMTARSLLRYPFRNARFFRRMAQILIECMAGQSRHPATAARDEDERAER